MLTCMWEMGSCRYMGEIYMSCTPGDSRGYGHLEHPGFVTKPTNW